MNKDIAICVFTYKQPILLRKIESILNQKLQVFDIFIILMIQINLLKE